MISKGEGGRERGRERERNILEFIIALRDLPWPIFHSVLIR